MVLNTFRRNIIQRRDFDPTKAEDLVELKYFKDNGKWKSVCPFYLEEPFIEVPAMCESKFTNFMLAKILKSRKK
jgi:hypothetical protein